MFPFRVHLLKCPIETDDHSIYGAPFPFGLSFYDRVFVLAIGPGEIEGCPFAHVIIFAFRWRPILRWRFLSRAWQGDPPTGYILATDWTGRDREIIGWDWPVAYRRWKSAQIRATTFIYNFPRPIEEVRLSDYFADNHTVL